MECIRCHREIPEASAFCLHYGKRQAAAPPAVRRKSRRVSGTGTVYKLPGNRAKPWAAVGNGQYIGYYATKSEALQALGRIAGRSWGRPTTTRWNRSMTAGGRKASQR